MKLGLLIQKLQDVDPTGEMEVCIMNGDIWRIGTEPAYYDGPLFKVEFDKEGRPVTGTRIRTGSKLNIWPIYVEDALEYEDFKMQYATEDDRKRHEVSDNEKRYESKELDLEIQREHFTEWIFRKAQSIRPVTLNKVEKIVETATRFYDENKMGPDAPCLVCKTGKNTRQTEEDFWEDHILFEWDEYSRFDIKFVSHPTTISAVMTGTS